MQAHVGDAIAVHSRHVGEHERAGVITEVRGADGTPPYLVRWDDGKEAVFFPSADCTIAPKAGSSAR